MTKRSARLGSKSALSAEPPLVTEFAREVGYTFVGIGHICRRKNIPLEKIDGRVRFKHAEDAENIRAALHTLGLNKPPRAKRSETRSAA